MKQHTDQYITYSNVELYIHEISDMFKHIIYKM